MKFIVKVEDFFNIPGKGCVIFPKIPYSFDLPIRIGAKLEIRNPSGNVIQATKNGSKLVGQRNITH